MIIDMPNTRTREIAHKIEQLHEERGESATGRVLTLLIATEDADLEHALEIANSASREHPCRVIAVVPGYQSCRSVRRRRTERGRSGRRGEPRVAIIRPSI